MTAITALVLGSILGYYVPSQRRAFGITTAALLAVLVFQTITLRNDGYDVDNWIYPTVQFAVLGLAYLTTTGGARLRAHRRPLTATTG